MPPRQRGTAAQESGVTLDHQLGAATAERSRPDLVLDQHRGSAATGIGADRFLHGKRFAVADVAIGQPQHVGRGENDGLDRVGHFRKDPKRSMSRIARRIAAMLEPETKPVRNPASSISRAPMPSPQTGMI